MFALPFPVPAFLTALVLTCGPVAALAHEIAGTLAYRPRIALPPDAVLALQALDGAGAIVAENRSDTEGAQVPLHFALTIPDETPVSLRVAITSGPETLWTIAPLDVAGATGRSELGEIALLPPAASGLPGDYRCGDVTVTIAAGQDGARLRLGGTWLAFAPAPSGSGARYEMAGAPDQWLWNKGRDFTVSLPVTGEVACTPLLPTATPFQAGGNEPGWRLTLKDGQAELALMEGGPVSGHLESVEALPDGRRLTYGRLVVDIADAVCRDTATGMPSPFTVTVRHGETTFAGCGGDPRSLLTGTPWAITSIAGQPVPPDVAPSAAFTNDGGIYGATGCNRYRGTFSLTGEGLSIGALAMTMMACPEINAATERALSEAFATVSRFDVAADGRLQLIAGDQVVVEAAP